MQVFSIERGGEFLKEMSSGRYNVPYFVKVSSDFERNYPKGSRDRYKLSPHHDPTSHSMFRLTARSEHICCILSSTQR